MPWRNKYIAPRRHALALSGYGLPLMLGLFFLFGLFDSAALSAAIGPWWQIAWEWLLAVGGALGLIGALLPPRFLVSALKIESTASWASACGFLVYAIAIVLVAGWRNPIWSLFVVLALGFVGRIVQVRLDLHRIYQLAKKL